MKGLGFGIKFWNGSDGGVIPPAGDAILDELLAAIKDELGNDILDEGP